MRDTAQAGLYLGDRLGGGFPGIGHRVPGGFARVGDRLASRVAAFGHRPGGTGTASRVLDETDGGYTVGVLVQANHGRRERFRVDGAPVGTILTGERVPLPSAPAGPRGGSIIGVVATDAPLLPHQCDRLAQRAALGVARAGGAGEQSSGDLFLAFSTGNRVAAAAGPPLALRMLPDASTDPLSYAVIEATEEAVVSALLSARTMTGRGGATAHALTVDELREAVEAVGRRTGVDR